MAGLPAADLAAGAAGVVLAVGAALGEVVVVLVVAAHRGDGK